MTPSETSRRARWAAARLRKINYERWRTRRGSALEFAAREFDNIATAARRRARKAKVAKAKRLAARKIKRVEARRQRFLDMAHARIDAAQAITRKAKAGRK